MLPQNVRVRFGRCVRIVGSIVEWWIAKDGTANFGGVRKPVAQEMTTKTAFKFMERSELETIEPIIKAGNLVIELQNSLISDQTIQDRQSFMET